MNDNKDSMAEIDHAAPKRPILTTKRYRPSLSLDSLKHILYLSALDQANKSEIDRKANRTLQQALTPFIAKIEVGAMGPAYNVNNDYGKSIENKLGLDQNSAHIISQIHSDKIYWKQCYDKLMAGKDLTEAELAAADEHRYLEGMMDSKEEKEHERNEQV